MAIAIQNNEMMLLEVKAGTTELRNVEANLLKIIVLLPLDCRYTYFQYIINGKSHWNLILGFKFSTLKKVYKAIRHIRENVNSYRLLIHQVGTLQDFNKIKVKTQ